MNATSSHYSTRAILPERCFCTRRVLSCHDDVDSIANSRCLFLAKEMQWLL